MELIYSSFCLFNMGKIDLYKKYFENLIEGNLSECKSILDDEIKAGKDFLVLAKEYFHKSMYDIGNYWSDGELDIAKEHLATQVTNDLISYSTSLFKTDNSINKTAIVTCLSNDYHDLGAKIVSGYFTIKGWKTYFLGANIPNNEIINLVKIKNADVIAISVNFYLIYIKLVNLLEKLSKEFPTKTVLVGGNCFNTISTDIFKNYSNVHFLPDIAEISNVLD